MVLIEVSSDSEAPSGDDASGDIVLVSSVDVPVEDNPDATIACVVA